MKHPVNRTKNDFNITNRFLSFAFASFVALSAYSEIETYQWIYSDDPNNLSTVEDIQGSKSLSGSFRLGEVTWDFKAISILGSTKRPLSVNENPTWGGIQFFQSKDEDGSNWYTEDFVVYTDFFKDCTIKEVSFRYGYDYKMSSIEVKIFGEEAGNSGTPFDPWNSQYSQEQIENRIFKWQGDIESDSADDNGDTPSIAFYFQRSPSTASAYQEPRAYLGDITIKYENNKSTATGIGTACEDEPETTYYDLLGHHVPTPSTGMYIRVRDGRAEKVFVP